ncbi:MAG: hypothetical protein EXX96DRAFT_580994 [Benjaminiella poitrasii]|nr:MAG: hypothetical protein EXX96DRAFT_580994 [Benjaminiella poitrasii]
MNDTIGYASYQKQSESTNETISIVLFFSILAILLISFVLYFWYTERHSIPVDQRGDQAVGQQQEIYLLVDNIIQQLKTTFRVPIWTLAVVLWHRLDRHRTTPDTTTHHDQRVYNTRFYHLASLGCLVSFTVSLAILLGSSSSVVLQSALFVFVLSINLYLMARQRCYYTERRKLFGNHDAHITAVYDTRFDDWDSMWSNWVQVTILVIEFLQLMTFPLRDLITLSNSDSLHQSSQTSTNTSEWVAFVMNAGGLMPDMRTPTWYTYSLWTAFSGTCLSVSVAVVIHAINWKYPYRISTRWVRWFIPVATLLYIPILTTFVSSAACQSLNTPFNDFSQNLRCHSASISRPVYFSISLLGYLIAYFMMTVFLTSYERIPNKNEIAYKSMSVAFIKNMGLLLAIVFLLVESTTNVNRMRAILSITILLAMICYNIKIRPCYVDKINFFRTASFTCILWTSTLVAILSDTNAAQSLGPLTVMYIIMGGWVFILLCFIVIYFIYYLQPSTQPTIDTSPHESTTTKSYQYY